MHTTFGANNYNSSEGLLVWYDQEPETSMYVTKVRVTRHATKIYSFVDMTQAAAAACVAAKRAQYTRQFATDTFENGVVTASTAQACKTEIVPSVTPCGSRDVTISVNETDVHYGTPSAGATYLDDPAALFTSENQRNYDESVMPSKTLAGLSFYSKRNRDVAQDLTVFYESEKHVGWTTFTRYATKRMSYVGMNQTAAENCAKAKIAQYTRLYGYIDSSLGTMALRNRSKMELGASVALRKNGVLWEVEIAVNEKDVKAASSSASVETLFAAENGRAYDESNDLQLSLVLLHPAQEGASFVTAEVCAACAIPDKTLSDCTFEYRVGASVEWIEAEVDWDVERGTTELPVVEEDIFCRITCASTESDTITATRS